MIDEIIEASFERDLTNEEIKEVRRVCIAATDDELGKIWARLVDHTRTRRIANIRAWSVVVAPLVLEAFDGDGDAEKK